MEGTLYKYDECYFLEYSNRIDPIHTKHKEMIDWMISRNFIKIGDALKIKNIIPLIDTGIYVYYKEDLDKVPYKWRHHDHNEKFYEDYEFVNNIGAKYLIELCLPWE